jgi:hypothetical protein
MAAPGRPIKPAFSPIATLDVELPVTRASLEALGVRGIQAGCGGESLYVEVERT